MRVKLTHPTRSGANEKPTHLPWVGFVNLSILPQILQYNANYFFAPRIASFAALATRNLTTFFAGIWIS